MASPCKRPPWPVDFKCPWALTWENTVTTQLHVFSMQVDASIVSSHSAQSKKEGALLSVPYTTLFQYLHLLKRVSSLLNELGPRALIYLAAAVSDYYISPAAMVHHTVEHMVHHAVVHMVQHT